jgi:hypothetical protein
MKPFLPLVLLAVAASCAAPIPKITGMPAPPPVPVEAEHEWLAQLAGDWSVSGEADMGPEMGKVNMDWVDRTRMFGDYFVVSDVAADFDGTRWNGRMTLGWDPAQQAFVGTWMDTTNHYLWHYQGSLDASRAKLTLAAKGPSMMDPTQMANYRDVVEILGPNSKRLSSWIQGPDGQWTEFMTATSTRK